jgi:hypothetical protein
VRDGDRGREAIREKERGERERPRPPRANASGGREVEVEEGLVRRRRRDVDSLEDDERVPV